MENLYQVLPTSWTQREALRDKGQFWTPAWVAEAMVSYVAPESGLIFDPATGEGAFFRALLKLDKSKISYFGIDIDKKVLEIPLYQKPNCHVENRDFIKNPPQRKFRAIIANPPYIRHHRIDKETKYILKQLSQSIVGFTIDGRAGYHIYFLIQALNLLESNGKLAFIMPADTCEGTFATKLWNWISRQYCIEAVVTFDKQATPFPKVDTNAIIFLIKNARPKSTFFWLKVNQTHPYELTQFITTNFTVQNYQTLSIFTRELSEAINTGLTRPESKIDQFKYHLHDFAKVMRGIATGSNEFFFMTAAQVHELKIPDSFLHRAIGRTRDVASDIVTKQDIQDLDAKDRPTYLLSIREQDNLPATVNRYLQKGEAIGLPNRSLIKQRKPWYKMEQRKVPPLLFTYLGRRNTRFILNEAQVLPLTCFLCVYPLLENQHYIERLWKALNHPATLENLSLVGKSYGSGAIKVEPSSLNHLPIPEYIVNQFELQYNDRQEKQLELFK